eukprot:Gb_12502 [translate_table: standard]
MLRREPFWPLDTTPSIPSLEVIQGYQGCTKACSCMPNNPVCYWVNPCSIFLAFTLAYGSSSSAAGLHLATVFYMTFPIATLLMIDFCMARKSILTTDLYAQHLDYRQGREYSLSVALSLFSQPWKKNLGLLPPA